MTRNQSIASFAELNMTIRTFFDVADKRITCFAVKNETFLQRLFKFYPLHLLHV